MSQVTIEPASGFMKIDLSELWNYRELAMLLSWRDVLVRYKHTLLGVLWVIIQPLAFTLIFTVLFGSFAKMPSDGHPYPLLAFAGLLPWQYFARVISEGSGSLVGNRGLITKVYFPRLVIPVAACIPPLLDFLVSFVVLLVMMLCYHAAFHLELMAVPLVLALLVAFSLGLLLWTSALCAYYKDVRFIVPFGVQLLMFVSPVAYASKLVPASWHFLYVLNPMVGIIGGFRWAILGAAEFPGTEVLVAAAVTSVLLFTGLWYFRQVEGGIADVV